MGKNKPRLAQTLLVPPQNNVLYYGDNLDIIRNYIPSNTIDLIYLDPPFNSKADYNVLFKEVTGEPATAQIQAFSDFWHWDRASARTYTYLSTSNKVSTQVATAAEGIYRMLGRNDMTAYLFMMMIRLVELHRVLKPRGSLYLHCDPNASHYLKIVLDAIFDPRNFRNEIVWRRTGAHGPLKTFGPIHDTLLFYTKSNDYHFAVVQRPYMKGHVESRYTKEEDGRLKFTSGGNVLTGAGATKGESGQSWRGFDPSAKNRHWAVPGFLTEGQPDDFKKLGVLDKLETLYKFGLIDIKEGTEWPTPVRYLDPQHAGQPLQDIWAFQPYTDGTVWGTKEGIDADVKWLGPTDPERLGYQTQKPLGLLDRIINSSCPKDGWVLDPFCGCGTAISSAQRANRHWIGIDITYLAINIVANRIRYAFPFTKFGIEGQPKDVGAARALATDDKLHGRYQFQCWALSLIGAAPAGQKNGQIKKGPDQGIDGWCRFADGNGNIHRVVVSVKSGHVEVKDIRELDQVVTRQGASMGLFITLQEPTGKMVNEAKGSGSFKHPTWEHEYPRIQILTVAELLQDKGPDLPPTISPFQEAPFTKSISDVGYGSLY